jgi:ATPase subunit of ABC transporter with duplicated ATPase domains
MGAAHPDTGVAAAAAIEVRHLAYRYGSRWIYADLSFSVPAGRVIALLGKTVFVASHVLRVWPPESAAKCLTALSGLTGERAQHGPATLSMRGLVHWREQRAQQTERLAPVACNGAG